MQRLTTIKPVYALLTPFFVVMGVFFVMPLFVVAGYSLMQSGPYGGVVWKFSWDAYTQILYERDFDGNLNFNWGYLAVFIRSLKLAGIATLACVLLGFPTAWHMATRPPEKRNFWILLVTIPFWTNLLIRTYAWMLVLRSEGLVNTFLMDMKIISEPLPLLYNDFAITLGLAYSFLPFMILPVYANLERMDWRLIEAAEDLYATRARILWRVILPLAMPGIMSGAILVFIPAIGAFLAPALLGGGKELMIGNLIEQQFGFSRNWPFGSAISVIVMIIVMAGLLIIARKSGGAKSLL